MPSVGQAVLIVKDEKRKVDIAVGALADADRYAEKLAALPAFREQPRLEAKQQIPMDIVSAASSKVEVPTPR